MDPSTELQHHGDDREAHLGGAAPPVYRTSLFTFPDCSSLEAAFRGEGERPIYSRVSNPTVRMLERKVAFLEGTEDAIAFASGMGGISAVFLAFAASGRHVVCLSKVYSPALTVAQGLLRRLGVEVTFLPVEKVGELEQVLRPETQLIYVESPASLTFDVIDLDQVARVGRARGIPTATDNSWATPLFQKPCTRGIDLSLHSGTKYLGGHSDILLGLVAGNASAISRVRSLSTLLGASLSPEDAFLALRGLRTLPLRLARHQESALLLARRLLDTPHVTEVLHPALPFFPSHALWKRQFSGSSGLFAFRLRGDVRRFCDALEIFHLGVSWGGFESLVLPAAVLEAGYREKSENLRPDVPSDLIRLSVGLEDVEDLWRDLQRGFAALESAAPRVSSGISGSAG